MAIFSVIDTGSGADTFYEGMVKDAANWAVLEAALSAATTTILVGGGAGTVPVMTTCTGTGAPVKATSPTLVTPALGTPASGTLTNCTGLPVAGGGTGAATLADGGLVCGNGTAAVEVVSPGATTEILVGGGATTAPVWTTATGSGAPVRATSPTLVTPVLGTPASGTLTNCTGLPAAGVVGTAAVVANTIKGDGTAGRVIRIADVLIEDGTNASTIKVTMRQVWNGDTVALTDNIGKGGTTGSFDLSADGSTLLILDSALTGTLQGAIQGSTINISNLTTIQNMPVSKYTSGGENIQILFSTNNGTAVDLTTMTSGYIVVQFLYITSA